MLKRIFAAALAFLSIAGTAQVTVAAERPRVTLTTSKGVIVLELYSDRAPATVQNFLKYVRAGHYDGTIFHRVIPGFMIQGGGFTAGPLKEKSTGTPIRNEADNGVKNETGTIAMARTPNPHSATAQFFINVKDNGFLDHKEKSARGWGYAVFGKVVEGMDVVRVIEKTQTGTHQGIYENFPVEAITITSAKVTTGAK